MKNCKETECKCKNKFIQECSCSKCEEVERKIWERLGIESLRKIWDNPKDDEVWKQYTRI